MRLDRLTYAEIKAYEAILAIRDWLLPMRKMKRTDYYSLLTQVNQARIVLENKAYGCMTGKHATPCNCKSER